MLQQRVRSRRHCFLNQSTWRQFFQALEPIQTSFPLVFEI